MEQRVGDDGAATTNDAGAAVGGTGTLPPDLLRRPDVEGARWLALVRLHELATVRPRIDHSPDADALHDFRVALRRLRSVLRAYRDALDDSVSGRLRRRLAALAHAASAPRDADVHLLWLAAQRERLSVEEHGAVAWLERRLERERRLGAAALRRELADHFAALARRLDRRLRRYRVTFEVGGEYVPRASGALLAEALRTHVAVARSRLRSVRSIDDTRELHRARVAVKRLRYTLEPLAQAAVAPPAIVRSAAAAVSRLRRMQDDLGQVHDAHVFGSWLADRAAAAAARDARIAAELALHDDAGRPTSNGEPGGAVTAAVVSLQRILLADAERAYAAATDAKERRAVRRMLRSVESLADRLTGEG